MMSTPSLSDDSIIAGLKLANALRAQDRQLDAVQVLLEGVAAHPRDFRIRFALASAIDGFSLDSAGPAVREILLDLCRDENIAAQCFADAIIGLTKGSPAFSPLLAASVAGRDVLTACIADVSAWAREPLLPALLSRAVANDPDLERVLTQLRRCMLLHFDAERGRMDTGDAVTFDFACALARQCFNSEYALFAADDETALLAQLLQRIDAQLDKQDMSSAALEWPLAIAALYAPLNRLPRSERLLQRLPESFSGAFRPIWRDQIHHFRQEREISDRIEALTPVTQEVSQAVRGQYEDSPYPRWLAMLRPESRALAQVVPELPALDGRERRSILIAGCGTGQHPIHAAMMFPECEVVALDLSKASLSYAIRMAQSFELKNLSFFQADILELGSWTRRFDLIESLGVLHHMKDPLAGWRVLTGLLRDGGTMRIGLYSTIARRPLQAARDIVLATGFPKTPDDIRRARRIILDLPEGHPARSVLVSDDFYCASGCRDLLMHVQERTYTLTQIADCLRLLGLRLLGLQCPPEVIAGFRAAYHDPAALTDLSLWDQFEQQHPEIFRGMYQFTCRRKI